MSKMILMATAAAAMAFSMPALAQGKGQSKGPSVKSTGQVSTNVRARTDARANVRARTRTGASVDRRLDTNGNGVPDYREQRLADVNGNGILDYRERRMVDTNGKGIADYRERLIDRNRDGVDDRAQNRYGGAACPPGLAKKTPACVPPGQARRLYNEGQRIPSSYNQYTNYNLIPENYRDDIPEMYRGDAYRYIYRDDRIYVVDRTSRIVRDIIDRLD